MEKQPLKILWVHDELPAVVRSNQMLLTMILEEFEIEFLQAGDIEGAFNLYCDLSSEIDLVVADLGIPFGNTENWLSKMAEGETLWATAIYDETTGGMILVKLMVDYEREKRNDCNARLPCPVVYMSCWHYRPDRFIEYLNLWHHPETYYWWDMAKIDVDELAKHIQLIVKANKAVKT